MAFIPLKQFKATLDTMSEMLSRLGFLAEVRGVLNDIRVTPTGTVTVAGTITTVTAIGGLQASSQVANFMNTDAILTNYNNLIRS